MDLLRYVNILHGTDSTRRFSHGNTLPLTALPHALAAFVPQTNGGRDTWFYHPDDRSIEGIRLTHQPCPWGTDFSHFCFMPQDGVQISEEARWSGFRPEETELHPHYIDVTFLRAAARLQLAPTDSGAVMRLTFGEFAREPRFAVLPFQFDGEVRVDIARRMIIGYTTAKHRDFERTDFKYWFVFRFDCDISAPMITDGECARGGDCGCGRSAGATVLLSSRDVTVRLATSYLSEEQALLNLQRETDGISYAEARDAAASEWERVLNLIHVQGGARYVRTFYSCMYRAFLYPTKFYEIAADGRPYHIDAETNTLRDGVMYTNNGFWDTYRTVYPLYSLICPDRCREILIGYLNFYDDTGYLPKWTSQREAGGMPGTLIEAVFADAIIKGILTGNDARRAYTAMVKNATVSSGNMKQGRKCVAEYGALGYVPYTLCKESVNETLDCAYGDWCVSQVATVFGEREQAEFFRTRSRNYKNLFDPETGFMRAKDEQGNFREDFDCFAWGRDYTEGSAWQNSFAVPHDYVGLAELYGGTSEFLKKIDELFDAPPLYRLGGYGGEIHEMTEMAAVDFGQCAISNQPSFHLPFLYAEFGNAERSRRIVRDLVDSVFSPNNDGFPGDEDNGTMACWYIFSTLGFYPMCPGCAEYTYCGSVFDHAEMLVDGKYRNLETVFATRTANKIAYHAFFDECTE